MLGSSNPKQSSQRLCNLPKPAQRFDLRAPALYPRLRDLYGFPNARTSTSLLMPAFSQGEMNLEDISSPKPVSSNCKETLGNNSRPIFPSPDDFDGLLPTLRVIRPTHIAEEDERLLRPNHDLLNQPHADEMLEIWNRDHARRADRDLHAKRLNFFLISPLSSAKAGTPAQCARASLFRRSRAGQQ